MNRLPPLNYLKSLFDYDPDTGLITRKENGHVYKLGKGKSYIIIMLKGVSFKAHRIAYYLGTGKDPGDLMIDHINRDRSDNRLSNLRLVNRVLQNMNRSNAVLLEHAGVTMTLADWARKLDMSPRTIRHRLKRGLSVSEALSL